jgi:isocitrate dehydrogenase kinase/phosphatase
MADITINTDGTTQNTKLTVDGEEVTKNKKVVTIYMSAHAPYKSKYDGEVYGNYVSLEYTIVDDNGVAETKSYSNPTTNYTKSIGIKDNKIEDSIVRFIGDEIDTNISTLVDSIIKHCEDNKIKCPSKNVLINRTEQSLKDTLEDYGVKLNG